jgi:hypothetical protein
VATFRVGSEVARNAILNLKMTIVNPMKEASKTFQNIIVAMTTQQRRVTR